MDENALDDMLMTGLVVGTRLVRLSLGDAAAGLEAQRMVCEKVQAAADGYAALTIGMMFGDSRVWCDPVGTFVAPGRKTLKSNAKRLAGYPG